MKKIITLLMTLTLVIGALALPALAEETTQATDTTSSATQQTGKGHGRNNQMPGNGQMPQMPGQNSQFPQQPGQGGRNGQMPGNGQQPQMPGQNDRNGQNDQQSQLPEQNTQNGQNDQNSQNNQQTLPGKNGRGSKHGGRNGQMPGNGQQLFDQLLKDGVITQETYDAIAAYLQKNAPQQQDAAAAPAEGNEPPSAPEGQQEAPEQKLLKDMLDKGIITQEQYDEYLAKLTPAAPADTAEPAGNT